MIRGFLAPVLGLRIRQILNGHQRDKLGGQFFISHAAESGAEEGQNCAALVCFREIGKKSS
ncbi:hypothetical protein ACFY4C_36565 [Actinomadura viridis]|uniref:hypothetical protein n=1 Tax=Actinomadura viridis TaxID=58110 RepID=UPI0036BA0D11